MIGKLFIRAWLALLLLWATAARAAPQVIEAWSYYPAPPFQTDAVSGAGLTADLVDYLNKAFAGRYEVRTVLLPRARLNMMLENGARAFVVFAPSVVFGGADGGSYLWTSPLFADRQDLVSRRDRPFEFNGAASLSGVNFAAMLGHVYPMIAREVEMGQIRVDWAHSEISLVSMLMAGHVDVVTLPNSSIRYFMKGNRAFAHKAVLSSQSLGDYTRHLMFQKGMEKERDDFERVVRKMSKDPAWLTVLARYGLEPVRPIASGPPKNDATKP